MAKICEKCYYKFEHSLEDAPGWVMTFCSCKEKGSMAFVYSNQKCEFFLPKIMGEFKEKLDENAQKDSE